VDKNPIKFPKEVLSRGDDVLLSFLRQRSKGTEVVYRMKLMFVGHGNVGKTSLLRALRRQVLLCVDLISFPAHATTA
jgi:GTP-binding protein EngB required for normal cell division